MPMQHKPPGAFASELAQQTPRIQCGGVTLLTIGVSEANQQNFRHVKSTTEDGMHDIHVTVACKCEYIYICYLSLNIYIYTYTYNSLYVDQ